MAQITVKTRPIQSAPDVSDLIAAIARGEDVTLDNADEPVCLALRLAVVQGRLAPEALRFVHADGSETHVSTTGDVDHWPAGLFSEDFEAVKAIRREQRARGGK